MKATRLLTLIVVRSDAFTSIGGGYRMARFSSLRLASSSSSSGYLDRLSGGQTPAPAVQTAYGSAYLDQLSSGQAPTMVYASSFTSSAGVQNAQGHDGFETVPILSLRHADAIANHAILCCERNGFNPVTVYVLDSSGLPIVSKRMDGCPPVGIPDIAKAKAYSCIVNKYPSRAFRDRYTGENASAKFCQMTTMVAISGNNMAPFPGGIVLKLDGHIIGAVGVSGAAGDEDEYCAIRGVVEANIGLTTVPEQHSCTTVKDNFY